MQKRPEVVWVNYPGLISSKYYDLAQEYLPEGQSGIVTFGLKGGYEAAKKLRMKPNFSHCWRILVIQNH